jgi:uncharacterized protein (DUF952 family)
MKQIFFIYRDSVVTELAKSILAKGGISTYTMNSVDENFAYLVNDLNPELILVDEKLYLESKDLIDASVKDAKVNGKWVYLTENEGDMGPFHLQYVLPLKAKTLEDDLKYLVEQEPVKN